MCSRKLSRRSGSRRSSAAFSQSAFRRRPAGPTVLVQRHETQDPTVGELAEVDIRPIVLNDLLLYRAAGAWAGRTGRQPGLGNQVQIARSVRPTAAPPESLRSVRSTFCAFAPSAPGVGRLGSSRPPAMVLYSPAGPAHRQPSSAISIGSPHEARDGPEAASAMSRDFSQTGIPVFLFMTSRPAGTCRGLGRNVVDRLRVMLAPYRPQKLVGIQIPRLPGRGLAYVLGCGFVMVPSAALPGCLRSDRHHYDLGIQSDVVEIRPKPSRRASGSFARRSAGDGRHALSGNRACCARWENRRGRCRLHHRTGRFLTGRAMPRRAVQRPCCPGLRKLRSPAPPRCFAARRRRL